MFNKEQIATYKKMAKEAASVGMEARIKANLEKTCDKYKGHEDKLPGCIKYLVSVAKEILGGKNGEVADEVCFRICRDYFNDEIYLQKETKEAAKKILEKKAPAKAKTKTKFKSTPTPLNPIIEAAKKTEEPKPEEKPVEKKEAPAMYPLQLDLFAMGAV